MDWLSPFQFPFMQNAFLVTLFIAPPAALLSCFLVLKGWSLMGDAISHATLPGIVIAYILNIPLIIGAFAFYLGRNFDQLKARVKEANTLSRASKVGAFLILYLWFLYLITLVL